MEKIILSDNTEIQISEGASLERIVLETEDFAGLGPIATAIKKGGNLDTVQFVSGKKVTGEYEDMKLITPLFQEVDVTEDGKVQAVFTIREKTEIEKEIDAVKAGQEIQDGAIADLGDIVSGMTEGSAEL